ncbi:MAG: efflux RND transporter periplasmic adaptor subunit [Acidobacteria bacterium]|nr:efflux RND transporter periplasmic adaptor subunit [Acidobacteriota bacterium]
MKWKAILIAVMGIALAGGLWWQSDAIGSRVAQWIQPVEEHPVPTMPLSGREYRVSVAATGELTGLETIPLMAPMTRIRPLKIAWLIKEGSLVAAGDTVIRFDSSQAADILEKNENQVNSYGHRIAKAEKDSQTEAEVLVLEYQGAELDMRHARQQIRRDEDIFSRWDIQESLVNAALAQYRMDVIDHKRTLNGNQSQADIQILNIEQRKADFEVQNAQETLSKLEITATADGVVLYRTSWFRELEVGAEVWPGQPLVEIARLHQFKGKAYIAESEFRGIDTGQPVELVIEAFPDRTFRGAVQQVAKAPQQLSREDPRRYFECDVTIDVEPDWLTRLKPGMRFHSFIEAGRYENAMVVPKSAVIKQEDRHVIYLRDQAVAEAGDPATAYREQTVEIVDSNHGFYVVKGVADGSVVALRNPFREQELHLPDFNAATGQSTTRRFIMVF